MRSPAPCRWRPWRSIRRWSACRQRDCSARSCASYRSCVRGTVSSMACWTSVPSARVGHVGLYRDPHTLMPVQYYMKLPEDLPQRLTVVVDPMLATGHSASAAVARVRDAGAVQVRFMCLIAAPEGLRAFRQEPSPTCRYSPGRSIAAWTTMAISGRALAMRVIGFTAPSAAPPRPASHRCRGHRRSTARSADRPPRCRGC